ncbi:MAG: DNA polymerase III subunit delta [Bacillota bacterium]
MIFLLYGADSFRRKQKLKELQDRFMAAVDPLGQSLVYVDAKQASPKEIREKMAGGSLFTAKRMVILEDAFANKDEALFSGLLETCQKQAGADDNAIVFNENDISPTKLKAEAKKLFAWLGKQPFVQEFKPLNNIQVLDFAKKSIAAKGGRISPSALALLISRTENDLWRLDNEIKKLIAASGGSNIDNALVEELVKGETEENIFALTDALGSRNRAAALQLLEEQFAAGLSAEYLLAMFQRQFKIMLQLKILQAEGRLSEAQLASKLKLHPFVVKKSLSQGSRFTLTELKQGLEGLLDLDFRNKQGKAEIKSELYAIVASLS